ncbi:hypothetical protein N9J51_01845 [Alphaproteobacteria bacterium]|nr:hypothetical protein [Alphaproteobacteria bacterium]
MTLLIGNGVNHIDGGTGNDTVSFAAVTTIGTLSLDDIRTSNDPTDSFVVTGVAVDMGTGAVEGANILINVENVTGTGRDDYLQGSDANEEFRGGAGNDILRGGGGVDILHGGVGNDWLNGGAGDDILHGGEGDDWLIGGDGDNILNGGAGVDVLIGGAGVNTLKGDAGDDIIAFFNGGQETATGGAGADKFVINVLDGVGVSATEVDIIKDFKIGEDKIHIIGDMNLNNLSLEFIAADGSAEAHFLLKKGDNVLVKIETDATAFTALANLNLATADHFEFAADFAELTASIGYDLSSYYTPDLL